MIKKFPIFFFVSLSILNISSYASETLDYTTEHLLETEMNARFQNLPDVERNSHSNDIRAKIGFARMKGGPSTSNNLLLGVQKTLSQNESYQTIINAFYDHSFINTENEMVTAEIIKNQAVITNQIATIRTAENNASARHFGLGLSEVYRLHTHVALHAGLSGEVYQVRKLQLHFTTVNEPSNFQGLINYDHTYTFIAPFIAFNYFFDELVLGLNTSARFIMAYPIPRKDLARRVSVGNNQLNLETEAKHIPDFFLGLGYSLESATKKWRIDAGATLDFFLLEGNVRHKGVSNPFFINYSFVL